VPYGSERRRFVGDLDRTTETWASEGTSRPTRTRLSGHASDHALGTEKMEHLEALQASPISLFGPGYPETTSTCRVAEAAFHQGVRSLVGTPSGRKAQAVPVASISDAV
jgi:hypothetical protein